MRERDKKFTLITVRFPKDRAPELDEAAGEIGLTRSEYLKVKGLQDLNARKAAAQAA